MHVRVLLARYRAYDALQRLRAARGSNPDALALPRRRARPRRLARARGGRGARAGSRRWRTRTGQGELARARAGRPARLPRAGRPRLPRARPAGAHALRRRGAARLAHRRARHLAHRRALRPRRAHRRPAPERRPAAHRRACGELAARGNAVLVIEHDPLLIRARDRVLELGPGAGAEGGRLVFDGTPAALADSDRPAHRPRPRRRTRVTSAAGAPPPGWIDVQGATANNLRGVDVRLPLGVLGAITGPSGSGKSTLAEDILYRAWPGRSGTRDVEPPGAVRAVVAGLPLAPRGRSSTSRRSAAPRAATPRPTPRRGTAFRKRFAAEPDARAARLRARPTSRSTSTAAAARPAPARATRRSRCSSSPTWRSSARPARAGASSDEVLEVRLAGHSVADVLAMTVDEALAALRRRPRHRRARSGRCSALGLGYLPLGQPLSTLSGGEAQRLKLARALGERAAGRALRPRRAERGPPREDVARVLEALHALVDARGERARRRARPRRHAAPPTGSSISGPGGGRDGGRVVAEGTPEDVARGDDAHRRRRSGRVGTRRGAAARRRCGRRRERRAARIEVEHAREHNLKDVSLQHPARQARGGHRAERLGQEHPRLRRRLRRGAAALHSRRSRPTRASSCRRCRGRTWSGHAACRRRSRSSSAPRAPGATQHRRHRHRDRPLPAAALRQARRRRTARTTTPPSRRARPTSSSREVARDAGSRRRCSRPPSAARKGTYLDVFTAAARAGIDRGHRATGARVDRRAAEAGAKTASTPSISWSTTGPLADARPAEAFEQALALGPGGGQGARRARAATRLLSTERSCPRCGTAVPELDPRWFSFNTEQGRCEACEGTGRRGRAEAIARASRPTRARPATARGSRPCPARCGSSGERYARGGRSSPWCAALGRGAPLDAVRRRGAHRRGARSASSSGGSSSSSGSASATSRSTGRGDALAAARCSASGSPRSSGAASPARSTCSTSPPSACTRATPGGCSRTCARSSTPGARCSWSSTTPTRIRAADHLVDLGPGGRRHGGRIVAAGPARARCSPPRPRPPRGRSGSPVRGLRPARPPARDWLELDGRARQQPARRRPRAPRSAG